MRDTQPRSTIFLLHIQRIHKVFLELSHDEALQGYRLPLR